MPVTTEGNLFTFDLKDRLMAISGTILTNRIYEPTFPRALDPKYQRHQRVIAELAAGHVPNVIDNLSPHRVSLYWLLGPQKESCNHGLVPVSCNGRGDIHKRTWATSVANVMGNKPDLSAMACRRAPLDIWRRCRHLPKPPSQSEL